MRCRLNSGKRLLGSIKIGVVRTRIGTPVWNVTNHGKHHNGLSMTGREEMSVDLSETCLGADCDRDGKTPVDALVSHSRFKIGETVRIWKPGHAEHGLIATIAEVMPIQTYGGTEYRGPHAYRANGKGWHTTEGEYWFGGPLPDAMVCDEANYQSAKAERGRFWRD